MAQTKFKLPDDLKTQCISLVRGYKRRVRLYHERRYDALYGSPNPSDGQPRSNRTSDSTVDKAVCLEKIENMFDTKAMRAVEQSKLLIGLDCEDVRQQQAIMNAIWDSCIYGRNFSFDYHVVPVGKTNFYERRREFLHNIAKYMGFL